MKRAAIGLALLAVSSLLLFAAAPPSAAGVQLNDSVQTRFNNCAAGGSASQTVANGKYLLVVTDETTTVCTGHTCDGGNGARMPDGLVMLMAFNAPDGGTPVACMSAGAAGDLLFTRAY